MINVGRLMVFVGINIYSVVVVVFIFVVEIVNCCVVSLVGGRWIFYWLNSVMWCCCMYSINNVMMLVSISNVMILSNVVGKCVMVVICGVFYNSLIVLKVVVDMFSVFVLKVIVFVMCVGLSFVVVYRCVCIVFVVSELRLMVLFSV